VGRREDKVEEVVIDVCNNCFCKDLFDKGRDILYKLYLANYNYLDNMHTKRNLLYRLIVAERRSNKGTEKGVEMYTRQLKYDMDNTPNYKQENTGEYLDMMSYYTDCEYIEITCEELLEYYDLSYNYYKTLYENDESTDSYIRMQISRFSKAKFQKDFLEVLNLVKDIHNINDEKAFSTIEQMLCDIKEMDENLYEEALNIVNTTNLLVCI
jgi:hypothetical protein